MTEKLVAMTFEEASRWIASQEQRLAQFEAALDDIASRTDYTRDDCGKRAADALGAAPEPPVSTLCAICDQIKELHPSSHPWTPKPSAPETEVQP